MGMIVSLFPNLLRTDLGPSELVGESLLGLSKAFMILAMKMNINFSKS